VPRRPPVTQKDIAERKRVFDASRSWDFEEALDCLEMSKDALKERCGEQLSLICRLYWATKLGEQQETPARRAAALRKAQRQWPRRRDAIEQLKKAERSIEQGRKRAEQITDQAKRSLNQPWLPQSLEQEAARLPSFNAADPRPAFADLEEQYRRRSRAGRHQSRALEDTVHRLQAAASDIDKYLTWYEGESCPPGLIPFIEAVLNAAAISYPDPIDNASRFRRLMRQKRLEPSERRE
jgi:hypothetical protein